MVLVLLFAVRGFLRGTVAQVFVVLGVCAGLWVAGVVSRWLGGHWQGARPFLAFLALRWLVAALAGLALASAFQWWGDRLGQAVRKGPLGWLDRGGGTVVGAGLGALVSAFILLGALTIERPRAAHLAAARARVGAPTMGAAAGLCSFGEAYLPGSGWLKRRFLAAERRALHTRGHGSRVTTS